jgi:hypothetical protein
VVVVVVAMSVASLVAVADSVEKVTQTNLSSKNVKLHFGMRGLTYEGIIRISVCNGLKVTDQP